MITVDPIFDVPLEHAAYHVAASASGCIAAVDEQGHGTFLDADSHCLRRFRVGERSTALALSASGALLAVSGESGWRLVRVATGEELGRLTEPKACVAFSHGDSMLWTGHALSPTSLLVRLREVATLRVVAELEVPDPLGGSWWMMVNRPAHDDLALLAAAGQDGEQNFHLWFDGERVHVRALPGPWDTSPPAFDQTGRRYLCVGQDSVEHREFPSGILLGRLPRSPDNGFQEFVVYDGTEHALMWGHDGLLNLLRVQDMTVVDEIVLRGHEPRLASELGIAPFGPNEWWSDLFGFQSHPAGGILSTHREQPAPEKRHRLCWWRLPTFAG